VVASKLPDVMPEHWDTPGGAEMAREYLKKGRNELCKGEVSDLALANAVYLASRNDLNLIVWQTAAKERIRWLSAQLALANARASADAAAIRAKPITDFWPEAESIVNSDLVSKIFAACEWDELNEDGTMWATGIVQEAFARAALSGQGEAQGGWIVGNATGTRWRTWEGGMPEWTEDRSRATRYYSRADAEAVHREDEDAWQVTPYGEAQAEALSGLLRESLVKLQDVQGTSAPRQYACNLLARIETVVGKRP
jgi:hypothetical protein